MELQVPWAETRAPARPPGLAARPAPPAAAASRGSARGHGGIPWHLTRNPFSVREKHLRKRTHPAATSIFLPSQPVLEVDWLPQTQSSRPQGPNPQPPIAKEVAIRLEARGLGAFQMRS